MNKDITLPSELTTVGLSLEEIGAVFVMFSLVKLEHEEKVFWAKDEKFLEASCKIVDRGLITFEDLDNPLALTIDLTSLEKTKKPFWDIWEYDDNGNTIYSHDSNYGSSEEDCCKYTLSSKLECDSIIWVLSFSEVGELGTFDSIEEAEEEVRYLLEEEYKEIAKIDLSKLL